MFDVPVGCNIDDSWYLQHSPQFCEFLISPLAELEGLPTVVLPSMSNRNQERGPTNDASVDSSRKDESGEASREKGLRSKLGGKLSLLLLLASRSKRANMVPFVMHNSRLVVTGAMPAGDMGE